MSKSEELNSSVDEVFTMEKGGSLDSLESAEIRTLNSEQMDEQSNPTTWGNQLEFILSCVGYSVGLGNVWRFPYLAMSQGGAAFLIPYAICLFFIGTPLFFLELSLGQSTGLTASQVFNIVPIFKGVGYCMMIVCFVICVYYNIIMAWVIYFFGNSFQWSLPWSTCDNAWNTPGCFSFPTGMLNNSTNLGNSTDWNTTLLDNVTRRSSAEQFWLNNVLELSDGIDNMGSLNWKLVLCLIAAWFLTFLCVVKGIRSSGKVVYVTATAPYLFLTIILIRGVTLPGAWNGIKFYIIPDWSRLASFQIWSAAAMQIFFSLGVAYGGFITVSSYNRYNHRVMRDGILLPIICQLTSIYAGFAIFSVIGYMMFLAGIDDINELARQGPGLAFIAYPEALARIPGSAIWSVLFFAMLFTLGLDSEFVNLEVVTSGLNELFPTTFGKHKTLTLIFVVCVCILVGLPFVAQGGFYLFTLVDWYASAFSVMFLGIFECVAISYFYGIRRYLRDIEGMIGKLRIGTKITWGAFWMFITPVLITLIIINTCVNFEPPVTDSGRPYPSWSIALGWFIALISLVPFPINVIYMLVKNRHDMSSVFKPNAFFEKKVKARQDQFHRDQKKEMDGMVILS